MSWDFTVEPEFQELLDWADRFATDKVYKLDLLWPHDTYRPLTEMHACDVLVSNAGLSPLYPDLASVTETLYDKTHAVNAKGPFRLATLFGTSSPRLCRRGLVSAARRRCRRSAARMNA